jgi:CheY-like chemotaxis protein
VMDGLTFLNRLRQNPYHTGLPVVVLSAKEITASDQGILDEKASAVIQKGEGQEARIRDVLSRILPMIEREEVGIGPGDDPTG